MPVFTLLSDPRTYRPCANGDMLQDIPFRNHWFTHFEQHFALVMELALEVYGQSRAADIRACHDDFIAELHDLARRPDKFGELNVLVLDLIRQQKLMSYRLSDPFAHAKARENAAMLKLYPKIVAELDSHSPEGADKTLLLLIEGIFAGNIFDLGVQETARKFRQKSPDFVHTRDHLGGTRPWLVDHFDALATRLLHRQKTPACHKALFFVDNAGSDCVLGVLPFARWLARNGAEVVLAANRLPALNDVTHHELRELLRQAGALDPVLAELVKTKRLRVVESGGIAPLLDLRHISEALNQEAAGCDLVFFEGMGRGIESNFEAQLTVDAVKLGMIKDSSIAARHGGKVYDVVLRFDAGRHGEKKLRDQTKSLTRGPIEVESREY